MKKKRLACLALVAPVFALAACTSGASNLTLNSNWYRRTGTAISANTREELVYTVRFESSGINNFLSYGDENGEGRYQTVLSTQNTVLANGESETCYYLKSELSIPVTFTVNGESETFTDSVTSEVWFRDVRFELRPVRSVKTVVTHTPFTSTPETMEDAYVKYDYTHETTYDIDCKNANVKVEYRELSQDGSLQVVPIEQSVALDGSGSYFDNEQILFALRAVPMISSISFRSVNPVKRAQETLSTTKVPESVTEQISFSMNGAEKTEYEIAAYSVVLGYSGSNSGFSQTYTYAALTESSNNTYRNVLLRMDVPVIHSLGTLHYTLSSAQFCDV